ncbi:hypothetical protein ACJMK2_000661 [Sinanodonta woodiana]|uniref:Uncharacterized protein n=1 Tax=Sinanodonta woodiana TaxID=1069815 RepID=A0ABD3XQ53_SINWO
MAFGSKRVYTSLVCYSIQSFERLLSTCILLMYQSILVMALHISEASPNCTVTGIHYFCNNIATLTDLPLVLPINVRKVTLMGIYERKPSFSGERFTHHTWAKVSELSILEFTNVDRIESGFLNGLNELQFLSVSSCTHLGEIDPDTFYSTPNIEELHFNWNRVLDLSMVEAALIGKLSNLRYLYLIAIQGVKQHVVLGEKFVKALHRKNLTYLDISRVNAIYMEHILVPEVLANIVNLNLSYSSIMFPHGITDKAISLIKITCTFWILLV